MNEDPNRRKKEAAAIAAGTAVGVGGVMAHNSVKKAGGYKAVGQKAYGTAKDAADRGVDSVRGAGSNLRDSFRDGAGQPASTGRKLRDGAQIAADKANPGMARKIGGGLGRAQSSARDAIGQAGSAVKSKAGGLYQSGRQAIRDTRSVLKKTARSKGGSIGRKIAKYMSSKDMNRLINLEAKLDRALDL